MKHSQKAAGGLVVTRGHAAKLLESAEKAPDFIAVPVPVAVKDALDEAVFLAGNDHRRAKFFDQRRVQKQAVIPRCAARVPGFAR